MADSTAKVVERVADRHVKRLTDAFEAALSSGAADISEDALVRALERGQSAALRLVLPAANASHLRTLAAPRPLADHLLDVAEDSANATRCMTRPTVSRQLSAQEQAVSEATQIHNELSVQQVERQISAPASLPGEAPQAAPVVRSSADAGDADDMVDTVVRIGHRQHGINVYVITGAGDHVGVPSRLRRRLERWSRATGTTLHMVVFDRRISDDYSGHDYYYRSGIRTTTLAQMVRVTGGQHLRELVGR